MEIAGDDIKTYAMDHHGLVAAVCKDLGIAEKIDNRLGNKDPRRLVSAGTAAIAMIINGLGFTNRRLYLTPQFFESKPVELLLGNKAISAKQLDDHALGKALDEIADYGASTLFGELGFEIALENNLLGPLAHLDSTSLSVSGEYDSASEENVINITHGHSKDHRPDLKQVVMSLVVSGPSSIPIWMEAQDGNNSDKKSFDQTIEKVRAFKNQLKACPDFKWVADSALYNKDKLLKRNEYLWLTRVPETIKQARELIEKPDGEVEWTDRDGGYKTAAFYSNYGDVKQRWLLVYSEKSYIREKKTFERKVEKQEDELKKLLWHLGNDVFSCEADALKEAGEITKKYAYHTIDFRLEAVTKHQQSGRPKRGEKADVIGQRIVSAVSRDEEKIQTYLNRKGRFILGTNDLDKETFADEKMLSEYKQQQNIERGFRFLKDPWFMVDSIFLKSAKRIEALMMIMTLCLMVYNIGQYRLREALKNKNETIPNQINKAIQNPTLRWVFQIMEGIGVIRFFGKNIRDPIREVMTNLNDLRRKIIDLFGVTAQKIYGII